MARPAKCPESPSGGDAGRPRPVLPPSRSRDVSRVEASALARLVQLDKAKGKPDEAAKWRKELEASKPQSPPK